MTQSDEQTVTIEVDADAAAFVHQVIANINLSVSDPAMIEKATHLQAFLAASKAALEPGGGGDGR